MRDRDETDTRRPQEIVEELASTVRTPLRLSLEESRLLLDDPQALNDPLREQISAALTAVTITRLAATIEFRFGEALGVNPADLQQLEWDEASVQIEERVRQALEERKERLLGEDGQIVRDLESAQERVGGNDEQSKLRLLMLMAQGSRAYFDARTHRQMRQVYTRLYYIYFAAELLKNETTDSLEERVLEHLQGAQAAQRRAWQEAEAARQNFSVDSPQAEEFGGRVQNQIYRQVLLGAITELWVDYLTRVEALRVAISLEAYAQRDPLVQYKSRASEMFQELLEDIRGLVIGRLFAIQRRPNLELLEETAVEADETKPAALAQATGKKKRKRH
jgi:preprotein translocase subunit SecA